MEKLFVYAALGGAWVPAGLLRYEERGRLSRAAFRYGRRYLERADAFALDPLQLPLRDATFETPEGFALFNGIRDSGPDAWGRYLLDRRFGRRLSELEYVAATGDGRPGALGFSDDPQSGPKDYGPEGFAPCDARALEVEFCAGAVLDAQKEEDTERLREYLRYGPSLGGARPKASVLWAGVAHLAKFSLSSDSRDEPAIEYAAMTLAARAGLAAPRVQRLEALGRSVFLAERFDRRDGARVPFVSGLTLSGRHESDYADWSYLRLADAIAAFSDDHERDLRELFSRMVYNILIYNNDDHPRNFGFLHAGRNRWRLSPLYDAVPAGVSSQTFSLAMTVGVEGKKASIANALSGCERFRLERAEAASIVERLRETVAGWREHFRDSGVSAREIRALENAFSEKP